MAENSKRKRQDDIFSEMEREMGEFDRVRGEMEELMERMMERIPAEELKGRGAVHGFSIRIGQDGKPIVTEFGNVKKEMGREEPALPISGEREPLVDVIEGKAEIMVIAELPGVDRKDINARGEGRALIIGVESEGRRYYKEMELPATVDFPGARAKYNNGVLEIIMEKEAKGSAGKIIVK